MAGERPAAGRHLLQNALLVSIAEERPILLDASGVEGLSRPLAALSKVCVLLVVHVIRIF